jgi:hypothetical protein
MKKLILFCVLFSVTISAFAVERNEVMYAGGTAANLKAGVTGKLDVTSATEFVFATADAKLSVPYDSVTSFYYSQEVAHHLGLLPAIAVGLVKARQQRHFFHIAYRDGTGPVQVLVLEVSKDAQGPLRTTLDKRIPQAACARPARVCSERQ